MKILIIGSKGFIGYYLFEYLQQEKQNEIWGCDVIIDYEISNYFLIDQSNANYEEVFQNHTFDVCINCSGAASVPDSLINPQRDFYLNTLNVFNLLESIRKHQSDCKFLNLSSAAVYGNPQELPIQENAICLPLSPYGYHKRNAELICEEFYRFYNIRTCSVRIFSAYGNGLKKQLFWDIAQKAKKLNTITLFGTGKESRDFIHVDDIAAAVDIIIRKGRFEGSYYNVANGVEITIEVAAKTLLNALEWDGELHFTNQTRPGDPLRWCANIEPCLSLGYQQKMNLDLGLKEYATWLKG